MSRPLNVAYVILDFILMKTQLQIMIRVLVLLLMPLEKMELNVLEVYLQQVWVFVVIVTLEADIIWQKEDAVSRDTIGTMMLAFVNQWTSQQMNFTVHNT